VVRNVQMSDVTSAGVAIHDWVVVADSEYPDLLQGYRVAEVVRIRKSRSTPMFAEIDVKPQGNLLTLNEVMVLTGEQRR
jgi:cell shape-determining protein MreC